MEILSRLHKRLMKIGIRIEMGANYPWIYLDTVNGNRVNEKFLGNHGFTIMFHGVRLDSPEKLTDIKEIFKIIRKYK